jgi:hypothetical protein
MKTLSPTEQNKLISAVTDAIAFTKQGDTPNEALEKVARRENYTPNFIARMVEGFNKAKAVHIMKEASADTRHHPFDLADTSVIVSNIYEEKQKEAKRSFSLPPNLNTVDLLSPLFKEAKTKEVYRKDPELSASSYTRALTQQADFFGNMEKVAKFELNKHKYDFMKAIDKICDTCSYMLPKTLEKTARKAVNIYPEVGAKMMKIVSARLNVPIADECLQKTASGYFPPAEEPFLSMQRAYESAHKLARAEQWHEQLQKEANFVSDNLQRFLTASLANSVGDNKEKALFVQPTKEKTVGDALDPSYYNKIKALEAKRTLYSIINDNPNFKNYTHSQIVGAWNALADSHPVLLANSPAAASSLMLQQLETNGRKDLYEIGQAYKVEKDLADSRQPAKEDKKPVAEDTKNKGKDDAK